MSNEKSSDRVCRICGNAGNHRIYTAKEMMFGMGESFVYFECGSCGCVQLAAPPQNMARYYPNQYYSLSAGLLSRLANHVRDEYAYSGKGILGRMVFSFYPKFVLRTIRRQNWPLHSRILDVGCGTGAILRVLARHGYRHLHGVDPYLAKDITISSRLKLQKCEFMTITEKQDVIMFNHSLEHICEQQLVLMHARRLLADNGICFIRIPTASSFAWQHYRTEWVSLDAPRHFFLHSHESIRLLATQTGFLVQDIIQESSAFQFWASEQYRHGTSLMAVNSYMVNPLRSGFSRKQIRRYQDQADELNKNQRGDEIAVVLKPNPAWSEDHR